MALYILHIGIMWGVATRVREMLYCSKLKLISSVVEKVAQSLY